MVFVAGELGWRLRDEYSAAGREIRSSDDVGDDDVLSTFALPHSQLFSTLGALSERRKSTPTKLSFKSG